MDHPGRPDTLRLKRPAYPPEYSTRLPLLGHRPVSVEFGLLYAAFQRRLAKSEKEPLPWTLWALKILLFLTTMLVNGAGAFSSVIDAINLNSLSFAAIIEQFGNLPAIRQAALVMAVLSAFIIPIAHWSPETALQPWRWSAG